MVPGKLPGEEEVVIHTETVSSYTNGGHDVNISGVSGIEDAVAVIEDETVQGGGILTEVSVSSVSGSTVTLMANELDTTAATPAWAEVSGGTDIGDVLIIVK